MLFDSQAIRRFAVRVMVVWFACIAIPAQGITVGDLYEVALPIQGSREAAFAEAMKIVAVRVSGRRDAASRLGSATNNARQYVQRFSFTADNQLQVTFDTGSIDRVLSEAGLPIWGRERPATLVLLNAPVGAGAPMWLDASYPAAERESLAQIARLRGVPLVWPSLDPQDRSVLASDVGSAADLLAIAARHNANAVLLGRARRDTAGALSVRWTLASAEGAAEATGSLEDGVHLLADTFGQTYGASAGTLSSVGVEIAGIRSLDDYAATMSYLEGITLVRSVAVEQVSGETMRFQLAVRGDVTTLRRALALDNKLVPLNAESTVGVDRLQLRLQR